MLKNWNAGSQNTTHAELFGPRSTTRFSHVFTVTDSTWIVQAYGLPEGQCVCLEMVTGCKGGTDFEPVKKSCGCCLCLSADRNVIPIPLEGRYRLVACSEDGLGEFKVIAHPTGIQQDFWSGSMANNCCSTAAPPVTITSPKGTIVVGGTNPNFTVDIQPVLTASEIAASPPAMTILCNALVQSGCIPEIPDDIVTTVTYNAAGFTYTNEAGVAQFVPWPAPVPDVITTLTYNVSGLTYTNEAGVAQFVPWPADVLTRLLQVPGGIAYVDEAGNTTTIMFPTNTVDINVEAISYDPATKQIVLKETDGSTHSIQLLDLVDPETVTTITNNGNGTFTYINEAGTVTTLDVGLMLCQANLPLLGPLQC